MTKPKNNVKDKAKEENYQFDEDRMVNEGLAGGTVDPDYKKPAVDEARPLIKEEEPRDPEEVAEKEIDFEIDRMVDEGMAGGRVNEVNGKKQISEDPPADNKPDNNK